MKEVTVKGRVIQVSSIDPNYSWIVFDEILKICELNDFQSRKLYLLEMLAYQEYNQLVSDISETTNMSPIDSTVLLVRLVLIFNICLIASTKTIIEQSCLIEDFMDQFSNLMLFGKQRISVEELNKYLHSEGIGVVIVKKMVPDSESDGQKTILVLQKKMAARLAFEGECAFPIHGVCKN
ncbi:hypothetical protein [Maribellus sediminis]|uniref:hypothetical protein n=1 Tax=Maribellus sediminis TaxID=2696285 RepID=UPI00142F97B0|nr:hypothetical protein [Maribellus sediminis]